MTAVSESFLGRARVSAAVLALAVTTAAVAQTSPAQQPQDEQQQPSSASALNLPENLQLFGQPIPSVVKATAIVNGKVITQTDVDHRLAWLALSNGGQIPADQVEALRQQILRNLIDETLQIQAAEVEEITVTDQDVERMVTRVASNYSMTPAEMAEVLDKSGSSIASMRRQVKGEIAWRRLQDAKIENTVSVGDEEVQAVLDRMNAAKGTQQYHVGEIFLSASRETMPQAMARAQEILEQLRQGASFAAYARQFSEASTAAVGGDLSWVRPEQLPEQIAASLTKMQPGQVAIVPLPGGVSIIAVQDVRTMLTADPRDAVLSLKQVSINFPAGTSAAQAEPIVARFAEAAQNVGGCGGAERIANEFNAELVQSDDVRMRDLPMALQQIMLPMQVGQATRPFGSVEEGVRLLVICGRDVPDPTQPTFDQVLTQLSEERTNMRAQRFLRDLRRDAVIEFR